MIDYTVELSTGGDGFKESKSGLTERKYTLATDIQPSATYSFRVSARNSVGSSDFSEVLDIIAAS